MKGREEAESATYRERAWEWWENVALSRLATGGITCLMLTRWHEDDLAGRIAARPSPLRWRVLSMPAIAGDNDPLGREPGQEFPSVRDRPPGYFAHRQATMSRYVFASIYQQQPTAVEGNFFRRQTFRYWRATGPHPGHSLADGAMAGAWIDLEGLRTDLADPACWRFATCDLAASERTGADWTVISVWAIDRAGNLILLDRARGRVDMADHFAMAKPLRAQWRFDVLYVPREYWSKTLITDARTNGVPVAEVVTDSDKVTRAIPAAGRLAAGKVWWPHPDLPGCQWVRDEWEPEILAFNKGTHDDQTDTLSAAARIAAAHWTPPSPPAKPAVPAAGDIDAAYAGATGNGRHLDLMRAPLG